MKILSIVGFIIFVISIMFFLTYLAIFMDKTPVWLIALMMSLITISILLIALTAF